MKKLLLSFAAVFAAFSTDAQVTTWAPATAPYTGVTHDGSVTTGGSTNVTGYTWQWTTTQVSGSDDYTITNATLAGYVTITDGPSTLDGNSKIKFTVAGSGTLPAINITSNPKVQFYAKATLNAPKRIKVCAGDSEFGFNTDYACRNITINASTTDVLYTVNFADTAEFNCAWNGTACTQTQVQNYDIIKGITILGGTGVNGGPSQLMLAAGESIQINSIYAGSSATQTVTTAVSEALTLEGVSISPNPSNGKFKITEAVNVQVFNMKGTQVYSATDTDGIDLPNSEKGMYMIRMEKDGRYATEKVIVD